MANKKTYSIEEIDQIRGIIHLLYLADLGLTTYERMDLNEKMLNTYLSQNASYYDLAQMYREKQATEKKK